MDTPEPDETSSLLLTPPKSRTSSSKSYSKDAPLRYFPLDLQDFDGLLDSVGSEGRFQKFLLYGLLCPMAIAEPFFTMNLFFLLYVPDHWCHVNGRTNETEAEWRFKQIPSDPLTGYEQCIQYTSSRGLTDCKHGWDYDTTFYTSTIPSQFNWVCSQAAYGPRVFTMWTIGNCVGTLILGRAADKIGRKPVIFLSLLITIVFGGTSLFLPHYYEWYLATTFLSGLAYPTLTTSLALIASETCSKDYRSWVFTLICFCQMLGNVMFPMLAWALGTWFRIGLVSYIPAIIVLGAFWPFLPESPRWLLSIGAFDEAHKVLGKIARRNGKAVDANELAEDMLRVQRNMDAASKAGKNGGGENEKSFWVLFSTQTMAKHTILLCITWSLVGLLFYGLNLNTLNMNGNPFLNYVLVVGLTDLPAAAIYGLLVEKIGRRWSQVGLLIAASAVCLASYFVASGVGGADSVAIIVLGIAAKILVTMCDLIVDLQGSEMLPTLVRATGFGLGSTLAAFLQILAPYVIFMTDASMAIPFLILAGFAILAAIAASFLPETKGRNLPANVEEASMIGRGEKFWSLMPNRKAKQ